MKTKPMTAKQIEKLRKSLGMYQQEFADQLAVTRSLVSHWEKGIRTPSGPVLILLRQLEHEKKLVVAVDK